MADVALSHLFRVCSGDYHALADLDAGTTPLVSCGEENNGVVGHFSILPERRYRRAITVAYNGTRPLTSRFHPYEFGAKDDVAVLVPKRPMRDATLLFVAAALNRESWRYSYGRKCYKAKLKGVTVRLLVDDAGWVDEEAIAGLFPRQIRSYLPAKATITSEPLPAIGWQRLRVTDLFDVERGDFHSIAALDEGNHVTISRVSTDNGMVGFFSPPEGAAVYDRGRITVSTVGGHAFVQLRNFIATDNVLICAPKIPLRISTLFFLAFALNRQRWRYPYGRQCYIAKFSQITVEVPVNSDGSINEDLIAIMFQRSAYWKMISEFMQAPTIERL